MSTSEVKDFSFSPIPTAGNLKPSALNMDSTASVPVVGTVCSESGAVSLRDGAERWVLDGIVDVQRSFEITTVQRKNIL